MFSIQQLSDTEWEVLGADGARIGDVHDTYAEALAFIGGMLAVGRQAQLAEGDAAAPPADSGAEAGLLPESWESVDAIAYSQPTGDGRDFTECTWSGRDPAVSLLPLMLQTGTEMGHFGAELAGYIAELDGLGQGTDPTAAGRFYDNEAGRQFRDLLLGGRRFGVSVDPGRVTGDWECAAEDADGVCVAEQYNFAEYEVIGLTGTPFPAFATAAIQLGGVTASAAPWAGRVPAMAGGGGQANAYSNGNGHRPPQSVQLPTARAGLVTIEADEWDAMLRTSLQASAAATIDLAHPPERWLYEDEPELGAPFVLGSLGDEWLVDQGQGRLAMPLHLGDDGRVLGHLAVWGQCHTGYPGQCVSPPVSDAAYAHFHVGEVIVAKGGRVAAGALTAGCDHAVATLRAPEARDHYAHSGLPWAQVRVTNGAYGPWVSGVLRADVTQAQLAVLRGGALSGDWRRIGTALELIAALAVTTPGFPIAREAVVASGLRHLADSPRTRMRTEAGEAMALTASGLVRRCPDCQRRQLQAQAGLGISGAGSGDPEVLGLLRTLERRTRHLVDTEAEQRLARLRN